MASVSIYLNFSKDCEAAFTFYQSVFGGEFAGQGFQRFGGMPPTEGAPPMPDEVKNLILHVELPIVGGFQLMGSDAPEGFGPPIVAGNNAHINLQLDTREETKRLFDAFAEDGVVTMELAEMFWGDYFGSCTDKFGIQWMFNCAE
ncbi:MAG TPA: VOC family protein [Cytophagales bacterium]|nr:VOC family protein [Cytophagales bacterium]HAA18179.1 VOC family protein [Cytophagales bacterium]HAP59773.1 VOC family protein [Cytophagales bacterium]